MRTKVSPTVGPSTDIDVPEHRYRADLELLDRYLNFSAELLRLSMAGIAAIGFMMATLIHDGRLPPVLHSNWFIWPTLSSLTLFAFASACALTHRYLASDGMYYHLRAIRHSLLFESGQGNDAVITAKDASKADEWRRNRRYDHSGWYLLASASLLFLGVLFAGASFIGLLFFIG